VIIMDTPKHSVSVAAVITDDQGRALLIQRRDNGHWEPPGGVLELSEPIEAGLRREVREETGLDIEPGPLTGVYKNMVRGVIALVFRCKIIGGRLSTSDEAMAFRWVSQQEIPQVALEAYAIRMLDGLRELAPAPVRHHDGAKIL
jgi:8-oxo-dGTP diphosphatase